MSRVIASSIVALLSLGGCSPVRYYATVKEPAVGGDARIDVKSTSVGMNEVRVDVQHLPPTDRLAGDYSAYVVWFKPLDQDPIKAGSLTYDLDDRRGVLTATTPYDVFVIMMTLEVDPGTSVPQGPVVMDQSVVSEHE